MSDPSCPPTVTLDSGETCTLDPEASERRINIFWIFTIDECRYRCELGLMTVTYWRLFGIVVRKRSTRRIS